MIDTIELRRGNIIYDSQGKIHEVDSITERGVNVSYEGETLDLSEDINPIPLTEEWLFRFGYKVKYKSITGTIYELETNNAYHDDASIVYYANVFGQNEGFYRKGRIISYVHHLQNLYYALTGIFI